MSDENNTAPPAFDVSSHEMGFRITWGDDPLDFIIQTREQAEAFAKKLDAVLNESFE